MMLLRTLANFFSPSLWRNFSQRERKKDQGERNDLEDLQRVSNYSSITCFSLARMSPETAGAV